MALRLQDRAQAVTLVGYVRSSGGNRRALLPLFTLYACPRVRSIKEYFVWEKTLRMTRPRSQKQNG